MEKEYVKPIVVSKIFEEHRKEIYLYTIDKFGYYQAEVYDKKIENSLRTLAMHNMLYPECRFLASKNKRYRNIILDAHLIVYRITAEKIEILDIIHSASSIRKIKGTRIIRIET
ncbi:MAG: type II toxin-antitoxin system RelE/ParE family toxin [Paludibacter sp.]|jgi:plasmid stabilization system protein ParE|nr:type II toxin-antitoxin system RelE/ParE family toxin [Paludibacter sp.]